MSWIPKGGIILKFRGVALLSIHPGGILFRGGSRCAIVFLRVSKVCSTQRTGGSIRFHRFIASSIIKNATRNVINIGGASTRENK